MHPNIFFKKILSSPKKAKAPKHANNVDVSWCRAGQNDKFTVNKLSISLDLVLFYFHSVCYLRFQNKGTLP